jgi:hypothetical protein
VSPPGCSPSRVTSTSTGSGASVTPDVIDTLERIGGSLLHGIQPAPLSSGRLDALLARLDDDDEVATVPAAPGGPELS